MFRTTDMVLIAVMLSAAAFTYKTKHEADNEMERIQTLRAQIAVEKDRIDVMKADWSLLRQPARLQTLAEFYKDELELEQVQARQIVRIDDLPIPPVELENLPEEPDLVADSRRDATVTGSVSR